MLIKILIALGLVIAGLVVYVALKPSEFHTERSVSINASAEKIFPYFNNLQKFNAWNPWAKMDPEAKNSYEGPAEGVGAAMSWDSKKQTGAGKMTIVQSTPNSLVQARMDFERPFKGTNTAEFTLRPEGQSTVVTWAISGKAAFIPKLICTLFMNHDKMVGGVFEKGLADLKAMVEKQ